ncbi:MAG: hypothetical protein U1F59_07620 [Candidatus Competibacteraceae bacterium]
MPKYLRVEFDRFKAERAFLHWLPVAEARQVDRERRAADPRPEGRGNAGSNRQRGEG